MSYNGPSQILDTPPNTPPTSDGKRDSLKRAVADILIGIGANALVQGSYVYASQMKSFAENYYADKLLEALQTEGERELLTKIFIRIFHFTLIRKGTFLPTKDRSDFLERISTISRICASIIGSGILTLSLQSDDRLMMLVLFLLSDYSLVRKKKLSSEIET